MVKYDDHNSGAGRDFQERWHHRWRGVGHGAGPDHAPGGARDPASGRASRRWSTRSTTVTPTRLFLPGVAAGSGIAGDGTAGRHRCARRGPHGGAGAARACCRAGARSTQLADGKPLVLCAKGLEQASGKLLGEVVSEALPQRAPGRAFGPELCSRRGARTAGRADARLRRRSSSGHSSSTRWAIASSGSTARPTSSARSSAAL